AALPDGDPLEPAGGPATTRQLRPCPQGRGARRPVAADEAVAGRRVRGNRCGLARVRQDPRAGVAADEVPGGGSAERSAPRSPATRTEGRAAAAAVGPGR